MSLPGQIAVGARLSADLHPRLNQALILTAFVGFQVLDSLTTHLGLALQHEELNRIMAPLMATQGELSAYAVKGTAVAVLLAILMMMSRRKPLVWHAYHVAAWITALGLIANLAQLLSGALTRPQPRRDREPARPTAARRTRPGTAWRSSCEGLPGP